MGFYKWRLRLKRVGSVRGNVRGSVKEIFCYMWMHADRMASYVDNSFRHAIMKNPADRTQQVRDNCTNAVQTSCVRGFIYLISCYTAAKMSIVFGELSKSNVNNSNWLRRSRDKGFYNSSWLATLKLVLLTYLNWLKSVYTCRVRLSCINSFLGKSLHNVSGFSCLNESV